MFDNRKKGRLGEKLAEKYLKKKGMSVVARNFETDIGEIDIIAIDKKTFVFVEVKYRRDDEFGRPAEAITAQKIRKINQVASQYILRHRLFGAEVRFDVIEIFAQSGEINHIIDAFDSYLRY